MIRSNTICAVLIASSALSAAAQDRMIYAADFGAGEITRCATDGSFCETILSGLPGPQGIAIDDLNGRIYWADTSTRAIHSANLDGSDPSIVSKTTGFPQGIDVDPASGAVYWTDPVFRSVNRFDPESATNEILITLSNIPQDVKYNPQTGRVLWLIPSTGVYAMSVDGGTPELLTQEFFSQAQVFALSPSLARLYWGAGANLRTQDVFGGCLDKLPPLVGQIRGIAFDETDETLYFSEADSSIVFAYKPRSDELQATPIATIAGEPWRLDVGPRTVEPRIVSNPDSVVVNTGAAFVLEIDLAGFDNPTIFWRKDGFVIPHIERFEGIGTTRLEVSQASLTDTGMYDCIVLDADHLTVRYSRPAVVGVRPTEN